MTWLPWLSCYSQSTLEIQKIVKELFDDIVAMSDANYVAEFQKIMADVLTRYRDSCQARFLSLFLGDKETLKLIGYGPPFQLSDQFSSL